jgi:CheY-like chemotaxis protein
MDEHKVVLLVEDNEDELFIYQTYLQREGFDVVAVKSAQQGLETLRDLHVDVVICDVMMRSMDGKEFVKRVRERQRGLKNLPVISFSAAEGGYLEPELIKAGATSFCSKNSPKEVLLAQVAALTDNSEQKHLLDSIQKRFG